MSLEWNRNLNSKGNKKSSMAVWWIQIQPKLNLVMHSNNLSKGQIFLNYKYYTIYNEVRQPIQSSDGIKTHINIS